ncbi:hypothetical protein LCGC14_2071530 [marine sediment metagenome]|uniref:Uncharacterized protein n=1 Tax=marine sediment metagenome TaxID=412755 RepID=A0A0F9GWQ6_9ZZZZ
MKKTSISLAVAAAVAKDPNLFDPTTVGPCTVCAGFAPADIELYRMDPDWKCYCDPSVPPSEILKDG